MLSAQANKTKAAMLSLMYNNETGLWCDGICGGATCKHDDAGCTNQTTSTSFHSQHYTLWLGITPDAGVNKVRKTASFLRFCHIIYCVCLSRACLGKSSVAWVRFYQCSPQNNAVGFFSLADGAGAQGNGHERKRLHCPFAYPWCTQYPLSGFTVL
jgi:hypothetical protein